MLDILENIFTLLGSPVQTDSPQWHISSSFDLGDRQGGDGPNSFCTVVSSLLKKLIKLFTEEFQGNRKNIKLEMIQRYEGLNSQT